MTRDPALLTLVYSCSGCSSAAQLGDHGVRKTRHDDADEGQADSLYAALADRVRAMNALHAPHPAGGCAGTGACRCAQSLESS